MSDIKKQTEDELLEEVTTSEYKYGFTTDIESDTIPKGLSEEVVRTISAKKNEPEWMLEYRLNAYKAWLEMEEPDWANVSYEKPNYQDVIYYSAPKQKPVLDSLDDLDPEMKRTFDKLGISLEEQKRLAKLKEMERSGKKLYVPVGKRYIGEDLAVAPIPVLLKFCKVRSQCFLFHLSRLKVQNLSNLA